MKLSGSYQINLEKQKVWEALNDPEILQKTIPGCEEFIKKSETEFTATATNKIGPFNASFTGDIELKDLNPPHSYKITGSGNSPVGFANGEATVSLEDEDNGTKLTYTVEANVGGKIAQVGSRLIDMTAKKMADIFFSIQNKAYHTHVLLHQDLILKYLFFLLLPYTILISNSYKTQLNSLNLNFVHLFFL